MSRHGVGSILVESDDRSGGIIGIFTERDLLKLVNLIQQGQHWNRPILTVMTRTLKCIELSELDQAGEIMLKHGFRHLPVVRTDKAGRHHVIGIVSMRDLFQAAVLKERAVHTQRTTDLDIVIYTSDLRLADVVRKVAPSSRKTPTNFHVYPSISDWPEEDLEKPILILDLDQTETKEWVAFLQRFSAQYDPSLTLIIFDPTRQSPKMQKILIEQQRKHGFLAFAKPVNLIALSELLGKA